MVRVLIISLLLFPMSAAAQEPPLLNAGAVDGVVLNEKSKPIAGATVYTNARFDLNHPPSAITDTRGRFFLKHVPAAPEVAVLAYKEKDGYPDNFFAFFKTSEKEFAIVKVEAGKTTHGVVIYRMKGARLNLKITDNSGAHIEANNLGLEFTRPDDPVYGRYGRGAGSPRYSMLVPPVPFQFTVHGTGYKPWSSGLLSPKSGATLSFTVRLDRN
jgi:hypothetical protein